MNNAMASMLKCLRGLRRMMRGDHFTPRLVLAALALAITIPAAPAADLAEIRERGVLKVAVSPLSPFVIKDSDGAYTGFEIDSTKALGEHLGVDVEYIEKPFCEMAAAIIDGEADIIASGFSNTLARRRVLDFSLPYHDTEYYLVLEKKASKQIKSLRAVNTKDLTIGYQQGGVSGQVARGEFYGADLKGFSSFADIVAAMRSGEIDGAVMFSPYQEMIRKNKKPKYTVAHDFALTRTIEAFAMQRDSVQLRDELNSWIIIRDITGYWDDLEKKWFNPENAIVGARPTRECAALKPVG